MANVATLLDTKKDPNELEWYHHWSKNLVSIFISDKSNENTAISILVNLMESVMVGNSCIKIPISEIEGVLDGMVSYDGAGNAPLVYMDGKLYLNRHFNTELKLAENIARLIHSYNENIDLSPYEYLLTDQHQKNAMSVVARSALSIITGGPGTGKTYTLARIIAAISHKQPKLKIALAAPTGKASQRMQEALHNAFSDSALVDKGLVSDELRGLLPVTLHRLIGKGTTGNTQFNESNRLPYDLIVVDEVSMLDISLANEFLSAVRDGSKVILLGDSDQLSSVDVGCFLFDLKSCKNLALNHAGLVTSRRFSDDAKIGSFARFILKSQQFNNSTQMLKAFSHEVVAPSNFEEVNLDLIKKDFVQVSLLDPELQSVSTLDQLAAGFKNYFERIKQYQCADHWDDGDVLSIAEIFDEYRILTATRIGFYGVVNLNQFMKERQCELLGVSESNDWYLGRPVMITENNYKLGLSNGDVGITLKHRLNYGEFEVYFPSSEKWVNANLLPASILSAYAMTIHKSQGSEFEHVAVVLDSGAEKLMGQELIYTAITRAKKAVSVFADMNAFFSAITTKSLRTSGLVQKIENVLTASELKNAS